MCILLLVIQARIHHLIVLPNMEKASLVVEEEKKTEVVAER